MGSDGVPVFSKHTNTRHWVVFCAVVLAVITYLLDRLGVHVTGQLAAFLIGKGIPHAVLA